MAESSLLTASPKRNYVRFLKQVLDAFDTSTGHSHDGTDSRALSATGNTLDQSYDQGGAGAGRSITADTGAVSITVPDTKNNACLTLTQNNTTNNPATLTITNAGTGNDITGNGGNWSVSPAGVGTFDSLSVGQVTLVNDTLPAGTNCYIGRDNTGDVTVNALTGKEVHIAIAGTDIVDVSASGLEVISGGLTVTAGGAAITGNSTVTGDLTVTGSLTFGGNWTVGATLTVDELVLDTDGAAPAATNCYAVRDNAGDFTVNAVTAKQFIVAVAGTDEYTFGATILDMLDNALDNVGYVILNAATAPAGTEVYLVNDNTGDLTLNALTGKKVQVAIAGTDEFGFSATAFEVASGNFVQFLGDNGVKDSNGNEVLEFSATAAATNGLLIKNAATGDPVIVSAQGTGATADRGIRFNDSNGNEVLLLGSVAAAVNEITVTNAATGANPTLSATGGDANIGITLLAKGTGAIVLNNGTDPVILQLMGAQAGYNNEIQDVNGNEILALQGVASAVNELAVTNAVTTANPAIVAQGGDAAISITVTPKGAGQLNVAPGTPGTAAAPDVILGGDVDSGLFGGTNIVAIATAGVERLRASAVGNIHVGNSTAAATAGDHAIYLTNATVNPSGLITNGVALYCTGGEFYALDAAGNATLNSSHSEDGDFIEYSYSARKDKTVVLHVEKALRALAAKFPAEFAAFVQENKGLVHKGDREAKGLARV